MSKLVEFGTVATETKATYFTGKNMDGAKAQQGSLWFYKTSDLDTSQPLRPAPQG